jgi:putative serine protease XkdF
MPWVAADADRHKKGLSAKQKRQWAHVANSALARCQAESGTDCEGRAVRQANSAVDKSFDSEDLTLVLDGAIAKADDSQQRLFGWASIAVQKDGTPLLDLQGDMIAIEELEEAFYAYVKEAGGLNFRHDGPVRGHLIEAMVFTPEKLEALGLAPGTLPLGAWVGFHVPEVADYQIIKASQYFMFSIEGEALREAF